MADPVSLIIASLVIAGGAVAGAQMGKGEGGEVVKPEPLSPLEIDDSKAESERLARQRRSLEQGRQSRRSLRIDPMPSTRADTGAGLRIL